MTTFPIHGHVASGFDRVATVFEENFTLGIDVGASFCVVRDGETVVDLWGGYVDLEYSMDWRENTLVNLYSTTKGLAAAAVAAVVEEGKLSYQAPVAEYWPELLAARDGLSVAQLLSHQAGLCGLRDPVSVQDLLDWEGMIARLEVEPPHWPPGTAAGYHAVTWGFLVGELVRRATGQTLGTLLAERIARPLDADIHLGMNDEDLVRVSAMIGPNRARQQGAPQTSAQSPDSFLRKMALENPVLRPYGDVSSDAWRRAEIASSNGHGNARGIARIYGALVSTSNPLLSTDAVSSMTTAEFEGRDQVLNRHVRWGRGVLLNSGNRLGPGRGAFGHDGTGGSTGFADPANRLGIGYAMNQMQPAGVKQDRASRLIAAVYDSL